MESNDDADNVEAMEMSSLVTGSWSSLEGESQPLLSQEKSAQVQGAVQPATVLTGKAAEATPNKVASTASEAVETPPRSSAPEAEDNKTEGNTAKGKSSHNSRLNKRSAPYQTNPLYFGTTPAPDNIISKASKTEKAATAANISVLDKITRKTMPPAAATSEDSDSQQSMPLVAASSEDSDSQHATINASSGSDSR
jgi:hypothetical protein